MRSMCAAVWQCVTWKPISAIVHLSRLFVQLEQLTLSGRVELWDKHA